MNVVTRGTIVEFISRHPDGKDSIESWYSEAKRARWSSPDDVVKHYPKASIVGYNRVVFNICGNRFRLVCAMQYKSKIVYIKFLGTHTEYGRIYVETYNGHPTKGA